MFNVQFPEFSTSDEEDEDHLLDQVLTLPKTIPTVGVNQVTASDFML